MVEFQGSATDIISNPLYGSPAPRLAEAIEPVGSAAGLIAMSPVLAASVSGFLTSFIHAGGPAWIEDKPMILAATGGSPRQRTVIDYAMRPIFSYLRARIVPTTVFASTEDGGAGNGHRPLAQRERANESAR